MSPIPFVSRLAARRSGPRHTLLRLAILLGVACTEPVAPPSLGSTDGLVKLTSATAGGPMVVAAGGTFTCAIEPRGQVLCWGTNHPGNRVAQSGYFTEISASDGYVCGLRNDGVVECWGTGNVVNGHYERPAKSSGHFLQISVAPNRACALRNDNAVECWGLDDSFQPLDDVHYSPEGTLIAKIATGDGFTCGITTDTDGHCWGRTAYYAPDLITDKIWVAAAGSNSCFHHPPTTIYCIGSAFPAEGFSVGYFGLRQMAVEFDGLCVIWESGGKLDCFDGGNFRQRYTPTSGSFVQMSVARHHGCAARDNGMLQCWKTTGVSWPAADLGPAQPPVPTVTTVPVPPNAMQVSWDDPSGRAIQYRVQRRRWLGGWEAWDTPRIVYESSLTDAPLIGDSVQYRATVCSFSACSEWNEGQVMAALEPTGMRLAAGASHACAIRADSTGVECWGDNSASQAPQVRDAAPGKYTEIAAGAQHSCALKDGGAECWGSNAQGQAPATRAATTSSFTSITGGGQHSCALRADGVVECWGANAAGQAPASVSAAESNVFSAVAAGTLHSCALRGDGVVECWGDNSDGRAPATRSASNGTSFIAIAAGGTASCALRLDGVVECWGSGGAAITKAPASGRFVRVAVGDGHACARRSDGVVECWGANGNGQGTPTVDPGPGIFREVVAGSGFSCARRPPLVACWGSAEAWITPVQSFTVTPTSVDDVTLAWNATGGLTRQVEHRVHAGASWGAWETLATLEAEDTGFADTDLSSGQHQWRMRSCFGMLGCSAWVGGGFTVASDAVPPPPAAPSVTPGGSTQVQWGAVDGTARYEIRRSSWNEFGSWEGWQAMAKTSATSFTDASMEAGRRYRFAVRACNATGCSGWVDGAPVRMPSPLVAWNGLTQLGASFEPCGLGLDGTVMCGTTHQQPSAGDYIELSNAQCALTSTGVVDCWSFGITSTWTAASGIFTQLSSTSDGKCALRTDANIECQGYLNVDESIEMRLKNVTTASGNYQQVAAGRVSIDTIAVLPGTPDHFAAYAGLRNDGAIVALEGAFPARTATTGTFTAAISPWQVGATIQWCGLRDDGRIECWNTFAGASTVLGAGTGRSFTKAVVGRTHMCALRDDGSVRCWGDNSSGQAPPTRLPPGGMTYIDIAAAEGFTCARRSAGGVDCWGTVSSKPEVPTGLDAHATASAIVLDWSAMSWRAQGQLLERRDAPSGGPLGVWATVAVPSPATNRFEDTGVTAGMRYEYRLSACNARGCSAYVKTIGRATAPLIAPGAATAQLDGNDITVSWEDLSSDETGFEVQRRAFDAGTGAWGTWSPVAGIPADDTETVDVGVPAASTLQYRVRSIRVAEASVWVITGAVQVP